MNEAVEDDFVAKDEKILLTLFKKLSPDMRGDLIHRAAQNVLVDQVDGDDFDKEASRKNEVHDELLDLVGRRKPISDWARTSNCIHAIDFWDEHERDKWILSSSAFDEYSASTVIESIQLACDNDRGFFPPHELTHERALEFFREWRWRVVEALEKKADES